MGSAWREAPVLRAGKGRRRKVLCSQGKTVDILVRKQGMSQGISSNTQGGEYGVHGLSQALARCATIKKLLQPTRSSCNWRRLDIKGWWRLLITTPAQTCRSAHYAALLRSTGLPYSHDRQDTRNSIIMLATHQLPQNSTDDTALGPFYLSQRE